MRVLVGVEGSEVAPGARLSDLVDIYEAKLADDPMIKVCKAKTGKSLLIFIVNGSVIKPDKYEAVILEHGDDVRINHPYFGG